jgi:hypothetical protein
MTPSLEEVVQSARPIIFPSDPPYNYWMRGTCFVACFNELGLVVTASHVMHDADPYSALVVPASTTGTRAAIPIDHWVMPTEERSLDDLMLGRFRVRDLVVTVPDCLRYVVPLHTNAVAVDAANLTNATQIVAMGCPGESRFVDYENKALEANLERLDLRYDGNDPAREMIHRVEILDSHGVCDLGGFSGSPVFVRAIEYRFIGVLIEASGGRGHLIDAQVVKSAAEAIYRHPGTRDFLNS